MKLVVGLGNPGKLYENTPHNVGFDVIKTLAGRLSCRLKLDSSFNARVGRSVLGAGPVLLVEPVTFMNLSGQAVGPILRYHRLELSDLLVALDDADLELGRLRIRTSGSSGGHRGLASIIDNVGSNSFARIRIGVGRNDPGRGLVQHVLTPFSAEDRATADQMVQAAADAVACVMESGVDAAMNRFNLKSRATKSTAESKGEEQR